MIRAPPSVLPFALTLLALLLLLTWTDAIPLTPCAAQPTIIQRQSQHVHIHPMNESATNPNPTSTPSLPSDSPADKSSSGIPLSQSTTTVIELIPAQQMKPDTTNTTPADSSSPASKSKLVAIAVESDHPFVPPHAQTASPVPSQEEANKQSLAWSQKSSSADSPASPSSAKQEAITASSSPLSATEQELQHPITMKQKMKMKMSNTNSTVDAPILSSSARTKLRIVKRRALRAQNQLIDARFDLASDNPIDFGITPSTPLYEAILSHGDLSIPAFHLSILPFLQPFVNLMQNAPCNLTAILPASSSIYQQADYYLNKHCGKDAKFASTDSCRTFNHLHKLDDVVVDNGYEVASNSLGNIQLTQMRVVQKLMKDSIQRFLNWNAQQPDDKRQVCDGETVFLPKVSDLQSVMDFVALKAITASKDTSSDDSRKQSSSSSSPSSFSSDDNVDLLSLQWKLQQLRQSDIDDDSTVQHPLAVKLLQRIKSNLKKRAKALRECVTANDQQRKQSNVTDADKPPSADVDCPQPPYTPTTDSSDFPSPSTSPSDSDSDSTLPSSYQRLQFRVRPYRVSAFMQRVIQALVSYHMLGFSAITSDMPIHLFAPTMLNDPMFINFGNGWSKSNNNTPTTSTSTQPSQSHLQPQVNSSQPMQVHSDSESAPSSSSSSPSFPFHSRLSQRQLNWPIKLHHSNIHTNAFQFDTNSKLSTGEDTDSDEATNTDSDSSDGSDSAASSTSTDSSTSASSTSSSSRPLDALIDIAIAHAFAVTPQEVNAPFDISNQALFAPSSTGASDNSNTSSNDTSTQRGGAASVFPAVIHFEKAETGVFVKMGAETTAWPSQAKIISPDIRVESGVIQIVDNVFFASPKSTRVLRKNGVFAFNAAVRSVGREVSDVVNYASGITLFVPQDSALAQIVARLPDLLVKKLIKDVAKFKINKIKINRMKKKKFTDNNDDDDDDDEKGQFKPLSNPPSSNSDSTSTSSDESSQQQVNMNSNFNFDEDANSSNAGNVDAESSTSSDDDDTVSDSLRSKLKQKLKMSLINKLKNKRMKMKWNSSEFTTSFNATTRIGRLATALRSLKATVPFDLAAWCQANGVDINQQPSQQQLNPQQSALSSAQLSALLLSHVFVGVTPSSEFAVGKSLQSIAGGNSVTLNCNGDNWSIGGANILFTDILTKNGMIHIIDQVIGGQQLSQSSISPRQMKLISGFDFSDQPVSTDVDDDSFGQRAKLMKLKIALAAAKHRLQSHGWSDNDEDDNDNEDDSNVADDDEDNEWDSDSSARRRMIARMLLRYKLLKNKLKQKLRQKLKHKLKQKLKSTLSGAAVSDDDMSDSDSITSSDCLFRSSRHCTIVDTLQLNPPFQSMRQSSRSLFSASNTPESTQCSAGQQVNGTSIKLKSSSSDYFSLPTVSKCYSPREYLCRQGKLVLRKAIKQRIAEARAQLRTKIQQLKAKLKQATQQ